LRLKILKKLRTASLNSEFTGSYKKSATKTIITVFVTITAFSCLFLAKPKPYPYIYFLLKSEFMPKLPTNKNMA